jgi:hypothetical protein
MVTADDPLVDPEAAPTSAGCQECLASDSGWWVHLRRCAACAHIGCCDSSPAQHATSHARETGHVLIQSFEPGEEWFYDYRTGQMSFGPQLAAPQSRPDEQGSPAPSDRVPADWRDLVR